MARERRSSKGQMGIQNNGTTKRSDRHQSRRKSPFSLESSSSFRYDRGLRSDKQRIPVRKGKDVMSMHKRFLLVLVSFLSCVSLATMTRPASAQITFEWATVGNPGNAADPVRSGSVPGIGSVAYVYRIAKHEVTNAQYAEFLNALAKTDTNGLYNANMGSNPRGGITQSGSAPNLTFAVKANMGNKPVTFVSFLNAMRFANWLHNGQPTGVQDASTTESGVYTISDGLSETRSPDAQFFIPTENEWWKAGYHQPSVQGGDVDDYWLYPTARNSVPTVGTANAVGDIANPGANVANYNRGTDWNGQDGNVTTVGSGGALSESFYGTSDQGGNVWEWNERLVTASTRGLLGGSWNDFENGLRSSAQSNSGHPTGSVGGNIGFRVATRVVCGDGVIEGGEECDDGNVADGDGCSSLCTVEAGYACNTTGPSVCTDNDECALGTHDCDVNATCTNAPGVFNCICDRGYGTAHPVQKITAPDGVPGDWFGWPVSIERDVAIVGAQQWNNTNGSKPGAAYIYRLTAGAWEFERKLTALDGSANDRFGFSASVSGDVAVVGAFWDDDACPTSTTCNSGSAYIFQRDEGGLDNWGQVAKLTANDAQAADSFGGTVSLSGDVAIIGAAGDDDRGNLAGAVYFFRFVSGVWTQTQKLTASDGTGNDHFGAAVSVSGNVAIVGAWGDYTGSIQWTGSAYVFRYNSATDTWLEEQKLVLPDPKEYQFFGGAVSIDGDLAIVGNRNDGGGAAYIFRYASGLWSVERKLTALDGATNDWLGGSVAISGDVAIMGAYGNDNVGPDDGSGYLFHRQSGDWPQEEKLIAPDREAGDEFGSFVSIDGGYVVIGAPFDDDACLSDPDCDSGTAYFYTIDSFCSDIDECNLRLNSCDLRATCGNTDGGYICTCNAGYTGDGMAGERGALFSDSGQALGDAFTWKSLVGDIDNDGDEDIVSLEHDYYRVQVYVNDGTGLFSYSASKSFQRTTDHRSGTLSDLDGDGDLDLVIGGDGSSSGIFLYSGDGTGGFTETWSYTWPFAQIDAVNVGDIDANGSLDLVSIGYISDDASIQVFLDDGTGTFLRTAISLGADYSQAKDAALVDLDNDLDLDLAVAFESFFDVSGVEVFLNSNGALTGTGQSLVASYPYGLDAGDVDGDGDVDLVVGNQASYPNQVLFNNGSGTFTESGQSLGGEATNDVVLGDIDLDGDLDLVAINEGHGGRGYVVYDNDGSGSFAEREFGSNNFKHNGNLVDVDGDGDLDLVTGDYATGASNNHSPDQVLLNSPGCIAGGDDECALGTHNCDVNATCTDTAGGFTCACNSGYSGDGVTCTDDDDCTLMTANCDANATCTNTPGSFTCTCNAGYSDDASLTFLESGGRVIVEAENFSSRVNTSSHNWEIVPGEATGFPSQFSNFRGDGYIQVLPDVLLGSSHPLEGGGPNSPPNVDYRIRIITPGTYRLYIRWSSHDNNSDSFYANIVELSDGTTNLGGVPITPIADFYRFADFSDAQNFAATPWVAVAGFEQGNACCSGYEVSTDWTIAAAGDYTVRFGLREDGAAIDAFVLQLATLSAPTLNGPSASDTIPAGANGVSCTDIDECTLGTDNCDLNASCANTQGSFTCACNAGYSGNGVTCAEIDECLTSPCDPNATCTNNPGSFNCDCNTDYEGDGFVCTLIDACPGDPGKTDPGVCGCGVPDVDSDGDGAFDCVDPCPNANPDDSDGDGVCGDVDNCPSSANAAQTDSDGDGAGDACDACPFDPDNDADGDGVCGDVDNCPSSTNATQVDSDSDGLGDVCDSCPLDADNDIDGDAVCGDVDNCPSSANAAQADSDFDGAGDACDACPFDSDNDIDGDGICGDIDNCPSIANTAQTDSDLDGAGDACDACPLDADNDSDGDDVCGDVDNCPSNANAAQTDSDLDGAGDVCDVCPLDPDDDADGDGVCGDVDSCPLIPAGLAATLTYTGDMLLPIDDSGLATVSLSGVLRNAVDAALADVPLTFTVTGSLGGFAGECMATTGAGGQAACLLNLTPDVYTVSVESAQAGCPLAMVEALLVVFDPKVPRATGGGFILPKAESTLPAASPLDKANFGFIVRIDNNQAAAGNLEFQYKAASINLKSFDMTWYTVSSNSAMFQGGATINGVGLFTFRVRATDGDQTGGQPDSFDITIWAGTDTEAAQPIHRAKNDLAGGSIVIHRK
ncbi:MAG: EGF domain-containing protein [Planctomycetota bacterium]